MGGGGGAGPNLPIIISQKHKFSFLLWFRHWPTRICNKINECYNFWNLVFNSWANKGKFLPYCNISLLILFTTLCSFWSSNCKIFILSLYNRPTGDQEVAGSTPAEVGNILSWRLIMKYFLWSFSPFRWFKKGSCQFLAKECAQYWLTAERTKPAQ